MFLVIFLLAFGVYTKGQQVFNLKYPIPEYINFSNVLSIDSGYIVAGAHFNPTLNVFIGFFDLNGTLKVEKSYAGKYPLFCNKGVLKKSNDGNYIIGSSTDSCAYLLKLNNNLDTFWLKFIWPVVNTRTLIYDWVETDNGYVIAGYHITGSTTQAILMKTDLDGNYLWHKYYGGIGVEYFTKVLPTPDGGLLMAGWSNSFNPLGVSPGNAGQWYVVKTDSVGNLQWQKNYGNPENDDGPVMGLIHSMDDNYILCGTIGSDFYNSGEYYYKNRIMKIDLNGNIIWDKIFEPNGIDNYLMDIIENPDGGLAVIGKDAIFPDVLYKLTPTGDIIWKRHLYMYNTDDCDQRLWHFDKTPDGGYVLVGYGLGIDANNTQEGWMVKTDANGCDGFIYPNWWGYPIHNCLDTQLVMHVTPATITISQGQAVTLHTFIDQGNTPVTVSYSPEVSHYPVYLSLPEATDSLTFYPMQDTTLQITATNAYGFVATATVQVHVVAGMGEVGAGERVSVTPNPANTFIDVEYAFIGEKPKHIEILSMQGTLLKTAYIKSALGKIRIIISDIAPGSYIVRAGKNAANLIIVK